MPWFKFIVYCLIAYIVVRFVGRLLDRELRGHRRGRGEPRSFKTSATAKCETCGTYVPESRAITFGGKSFCSPNCLSQKARKA
jgi:hypothetical protein